MSPFRAFLAVLPLVACSAGTNESHAGSGGGSVAGSSSGGATTSSGGAATAQGGSTGIVVGPNGGVAGEENCGFSNFDLRPVPADVLLVLDRSASMKDPADGTTTPPKWDIVVPAITEVIAQTGSRVSWGMKSFPEGEGKACIAGSVTSKVDVPVADNNADATIAAVKATTADGNGTPTADAITASVTYVQGLNDGHKKFLLLATDGEPSCNGTSEDSTGARTAAKVAVENAFKAGFPTYVVGVATTKTTATAALNDMATAGGVPIPGSTNPLANKYYLASTKDSLVTALQAITGAVAKSCVFKLDPVPPAPDFIAVKVNGTAIPRDPNAMQGWEYTNSAHTELQVYGSSCDTIQQSADNVRIIYGCVGVIPL
ncbi:MAG: VWA domain-containing protein [Polyangiaceae bacterium]